MSVSYPKIYDVIVIGGGHAGCEAALACARRGADTLLVTGNIDQIGAMSCNPAIGGLGKGNIVREIDALGGEMAKNIDESGIQFRKLNTTKGAAVQGTRAQADKYIYKMRMRYVLECQKNLTIKQAIVKSLIIKSEKLSGILLTSGDVFNTHSAVVTTGTFLRGLCHVGQTNFPGGRAGDAASHDLSESLTQDCGLELMRLKTGTVPRLDGRSINYSGLEEQHGDNPMPLFSFSKTHTRQKQVPCHITYTNSHTHEIIRGDLGKSPLYCGVIKGTGPRYCPSIEDKVVRFADKDRHQIFLEPEGLMTREVYPNGLSTSLPLDTQINFLRSICGLENVEITRPGYAVEYDAANPIQLKSNYETKTVKGLFLAGQINGTSGYEEAAGQGLMAGINAVQFIRGDEPVVLGRDRAYIGVMTDDLITKGVGGEPYRMFTSRAEYRLILREDDADRRLRKIGFDLGLVSADEYNSFLCKMSRLDSAASFSDRLIRRNDPFALAISAAIKKPLPDAIALNQLFKWPEVDASHLHATWHLLSDSPFDGDIFQLLLTDLRYKGYVDKYQREINKMSHYDRVTIPTNLCYDSVPSLSCEVREKLTRHKPQSLAQALKIPGITPAAVSHLEIYIASRRSA